MNRPVATVHHFTYGVITPALAYAMAFLGALLGLIFANRARESRGMAQVRWLLLATVAVGGTSVWLTHDLAMLGFDVPESMVRYDIRTLGESAAIAIAVVGTGLVLGGYGRPSTLRIALGGIICGAGVAAANHLATTA